MRTALSARQNNVPDGALIAFHCDAAEARTVYLAGDFNQWSPVSHPMRRQTDGSWALQVPLSRGYHPYKFFVDGEPKLDPNARSVPFCERLERVSLAIVDVPSGRPSDLRRLALASLCALREDQNSMHPWISDIR